MSSETNRDGDKMPAAESGHRQPQMDAFSERKEEILAVLSAVIDPGKKVVSCLMWV